MSEQQLQSVEQEQEVVERSGEVVPDRPKRLLRSRRDRVLFGVCGGIGQYFGVDPVLVRALWVLFTLVTGFFPGVLFYVVATIVIPENKGEEPAPGWRLPFESHVLWGGLLILAGLYFLLRSVGRRVLPALPPELASWWGFMWGTVRAMALPTVLIGIGLLLIFGVARKREGEGRRLTRSQDNRMITGVCGGIGEYFKVDPTWIRLAWVVLAVVTWGIAAVLYLVAMLAMPEEPVQQGQEIVEE